MGALERAQADIARGQHWKARQRLASYLATNGYDVDVVRMMGRVCFEMHDQQTAGRYWIVSDAEGAEVDECIRILFEECGRCAEHVVSQIPASVRKQKIEEYPKIVRRRLETLGVSAAMAARRVRPGNERSTSMWEKLVGVTLLVFGGLTFVVGIIYVIIWLGRIAKWVFGSR